MKKETNNKKNLIITYFLAFSTLLIVIFLFYKYDITFNLGTEEHGVSEEHRLSETTEQAVTKGLEDTEKLENLDEERERIKDKTDMERLDERRKQLKKFLFENLSNQTIKGLRK
jgi:hypothetical protein